MRFFVRGCEKMPRGASSKRGHEYEKLKERFEEEGRYKGREEEVAARIINKQRAEFGETKDEKKLKREGKSSDKKLPIENYERLTVSQITGKIGSLSKKDVRKIKKYEEQHRKRKTLMDKLDRAVGEK